MSRSPIRYVAAGATGLLASWGLALALGDGLRSATEVVALAAGASLALSVSGALVMTRLRRRSLALHMWVAVTTTVLGVAAGVVIASWRMFLSSADAKAMLVILVSTGTVGALTAIAMASRFHRAVTAVTGLAASIGKRPGSRFPAQSMPTKELSGLAAQLQDVAEQLHESILRERSLESSRRELVAWISHDLRTPLSGIRAVSEALEDGVASDPATVRKYLRTIHCEVERLSGMVDDLFRLSRIHAGLMNLRVEAVSLSDLVSDTLSLATPVAEAKGVLLSGEVAPDGLRVRVATTEFLRVMRNLLDNALRHTPEGGRVSVSARAVSLDAELSVRDGCGGIPESDLERVFEAGYRGDTARRPSSGTSAGLGLAIAQGLVQAHGGSILVENETQGCCFTVRLPLSIAS